MTKRTVRLYPRLLVNVFDKRQTTVRQTPLVPAEVLDVHKRIVRGAAEFLWPHKRQLHRVGFIALDLPRGAQMPPWLALVLDLLRQRPRAWQVRDLRGHNGGKRYLVRWLGWLKNTRRTR
jgi:hypothetical protein